MYVRQNIHIGLHFHILHCISTANAIKENFFKVLRCVFLLEKAKALSFQSQLKVLRLTKFCKIKALIYKCYKSTIILF